jgi:hypothetical protein
MGDRLVARPLPAQNNTTHRDADKHSCLEWDSNRRPQCFSGLRPRPHMQLFRPITNVCLTRFGYLILVTTELQFLNLTEVADLLFAADSMQHFKRLSPLRNKNRLVWSQQGARVSAPQNSQYTSVETLSLSQTVFTADCILSFRFVTDQGNKVFCF